MLTIGNGILGPRNNCRCGSVFAVRVFAAFVILCSSALANYQVTPLFTHNGYDYAASMIDEGTVRKFWWCGSGNTIGYSGPTDVIYASSAESVGGLGFGKSS